MKNVQEISKVVFAAASVADKDAKAAKKIRNDLLKAYRAIADAVKKIDSTVSNANAPGLTAAFFAGLKKGLVGNQKFDRQTAAKRLSAYYEGR